MKKGPCYNYFSWLKFLKQVFGLILLVFEDEVTE